MNIMDEYVLIKKTDYAKDWWGNGFKLWKEFCEKLGEHSACNEVICTIDTARKLYDEAKQIDGWKEFNGVCFQNPLHFESL